MVLGDQPERFLTEYLVPLAKDVIEKVETGAWCYGPERVLAFPPGIMLPDQERLHLGHLRHLATYTQEHVRKKVYGNPTEHLLNPKSRLAAAVAVLAYGEDGERARAAVWEQDGAGWVPSPAALVAAARREAPLGRPSDRSHRGLRHGQIWSHQVALDDVQ